MKNAPPTAVIANPNAAGGRAARILPELERRLRAEGVAYMLERTARPGHARDLACEARDRGVERLLVVGGDGTVHETVCGLMDGSTRPQDPAGIPALVVLPLGTGNDFFRMVRASGDLSTAVRTLKEGVPRAFEVGVVRWEGGQDCFVNLLGVGIDVEVLRHRPAFSRLPGLLQYLGALVAALLRYKAIPLRVTVAGPDGEIDVIEWPVLLAAVTVGPSVGGGFLLSPDARPDDGLLDLFLVKRLSLWKVIRYLPDILRGAAIDRPEIIQRQVTAVEIRAANGLALSFELDGELMGDPSPVLEVTMRANCLRVLELPGDGS